MFSCSRYRPKVFSCGCAGYPHTRGGRELWLPTPSSRLGTFHKSKIALEALYTRVGLSGVNPCTVQKGGPASLVLACWVAPGAISPWGLCRSGGLAGWGGQGLSLGQHSGCPGPPGLCCRTSWTGASEACGNIAPSATSCWSCDSGSPWSLRTWSHTRGTQAHGMPSPERLKSR